MQFEQLHSWDVSEEEAVAIQSAMSARVQKTNGFDPEKVKTVAGVDVSLKDKGQAAVVVLSFPDLQPVDYARATRELTFPYIPGLLSFRETPVVLDALAKLKALPDLLIVDGQGYAHPRRFGIACHVGVFIDRPTIGCAKSKLWGQHADPGPNPGDWTPVKDYKTKETIGAALRSKVRTNPLIVSIGHKIDLPTSLDFVIKCTRGYRVPETTRAAHNYAESAQQIGKPMIQGQLF